MSDQARGTTFDRHRAPFPSSLALPRGRFLEFTPTPLVMGILNVTPDSFSDGGQHFERAKAVEAGLRMIDEGASIVDVGGESTRPGAEPVAAREELARILPVIEGIRAASEVAISVDTRNGEVAREAIAAGADIVNDVTALRHDRSMVEVVSRAGVPLVLMHMRGEPKTMQSLAVYDDVVSDVLRELQERVEVAHAAGIVQTLVDPGIGFAKTVDQNLQLLAGCAVLGVLGPVLVGASRKRFVGQLTGREGRDRLHGSLAAVAAAARAGAAIVRVHDVAETHDFLAVWEAIEAFRGTALQGAR